MNLPERLDWPLFVYGVMKPGFPAFEAIRASVATSKRDSVMGELLVRDGLPLLGKNDRRNVTGYLLHWKPGQERTGYAAVCAFESRKHYKWSEVTLATGTQANALVIRFPDKGNPQHLDSSSWNLRDDPAFGPGLETVRRVLEEVDRMLGDTFDSNWQRFFRSQMAYLLLWSILERLSALCFGPGRDPMQRINKLHELPGMEDLVRQNVLRTDKVSDSRNPETAYGLDNTNTKNCFAYYYQVRSNLSHRGKGVFNEFNKVHSSLKELLAITEQYLSKLQEQEESGA
ncbi:gamma-glutamylcyclotransferase [Anthocerotibacter panamensis]|uniref:gamma-glutamylcyclotransferase n=1 Tax=Anthocerotibacter panamensis TaxID=2857077 RepID=UPI001C404406|nr:gamma-glutamylcyclotransferase [Anthocerotibacter panamensis]